jgi:hypothetical protein
MFSESHRGRTMLPTLLLFYLETNIQKSVFEVNKFFQITTPSRIFFNNS